MKRLLWIATFAGLSVALGYAADSSGQALTSAAEQRVSQITKGVPIAYQEEKKDPTFEETKEFILKYTRGLWQDNEGNTHTYALSISGKKLKFTRRFASKFITGFVEKIEVQLGDLDPTQVGKEEPEAPSIWLTTTDGARKISVEVTMIGPTHGPTNRKYLSRDMAVPGSDAPTSEEQDKMNARLKKAWTHLITLAGGKPSQKEPF